MGWLRESQDLVFKFNSKRSREARGPRHSRSLAQPEVNEIELMLQNRKCGWAQEGRRDEKARRKKDT